MITKDTRERQSADWLRKHTLSQEQLQKLLDEKISRAYNQYQALSKQEMLVQKHR